MLAVLKAVSHTFSCSLAIILSNILRLCSLEGAAPRRPGIFTGSSFLICLLLISSFLSLYVRGFVDLWTCETVLK